jgi:hypothetical protein
VRKISYLLFIHKDNVTRELAKYQTNAVIASIDDDEVEDLSIYSTNCESVLEIFIF